MLGHMHSKLTRLIPSAVCLNVPPFNGFHVVRLDSKNLLIFHFHLMPACSKMVALCKLHLVTGGRGQASSEGEGSSNTIRMTATQPTSFTLSFPWHQGWLVFSISSDGGHFVACSCNKMQRLRRREGET